MEDLRILDEQKKYIVTEFLDKLKIKNKKNLTCIIFIRNFNRDIEMFYEDNKLGRLRFTRGRTRYKGVS